ncbi:MAG TPA: CGNR zinc finger domain-containing protein [Mycobacterium sp.]
MSEWSASHRYKHASAPGGAGLIQDFLNTVRIHDYGPDLLADAALAREWSTTAVRTWAELRGVRAEAPVLNEADLSKLRALRDLIGQLVRGEAVDGSRIGAVSASFELSDTGEVRLIPVGTGWRRLASVLWAEVLLSQQEDTWRRIKQCHNHPCQSVFYDRSKNNSGVWCDVKTCGNAANLRASSARRRDRERAAAAGGLSPAPAAGAAIRGPN